MSGTPIRVVNGKLRLQHGIHASGSAIVRWDVDMNESRCVCLARSYKYIQRADLVGIRYSSIIIENLRRHLTPIVPQQLLLILG